MKVYFFSFDFIWFLDALFFMLGGFKGRCWFIAPQFLPPWAEPVDPSPVFVEKGGARAGDSSPWLDHRTLKLGVLAGKAKI